MTPAAAPRYCLRTGDGRYLTTALNPTTLVNEVDYVASPWLARLMSADEAERLIAALPDPPLHREEWTTPPPPPRRGRP